jgi:hypothetical protein
MWMLNARSNSVRYLVIHWVAVRPVKSEQEDGNHENACTGDCNSQSSASRDIVEIRNFRALVSPHGSQKHSKTHIQTTTAQLPEASGGSESESLDRFQPHVRGTRPMRPDATFEHGQTCTYITFPFGPAFPFRPGVRCQERPVTQLSRVLYLPYLTILGRVIYNNGLDGTGDVGGGDGGSCQQ